MGSIRRELLNYAEFLRESGNLYVEKGPTGIAASPTGDLPTDLTEESPAPPPRAETAHEPSREPDGFQADFLQALDAPPPLVGPIASEPDRRERAEKAARAAEACTACSLCHGRTQAVYGTGSLMARIMFVGEAPGADEDRTGIPFVGRAGKLLTQMIEAIGFRREEVYICNTIKCRPPENRDPLPGEKTACEHFLTEQIEIIRPQIMVALGAHAASYLTGLQASIGRLRRRWHQHRGALVMATYHPAFLLRSPGSKREAWEDLQMLAAKYAELNPADRRAVGRKADPGSSS